MTITTKNIINNNVDRSSIIEEVKKRLELSCEKDKTKLHEYLSKARADPNNKLKRMFVLGTGPSILSVNLDLLKNEFTVSMNKFNYGLYLKNINFRSIISYISSTCETEFNLLNNFKFLESPVNGSDIIINGDITSFADKNIDIKKLNKTPNFYFIVNNNNFTLTKKLEKSNLPKQKDADNDIKRKTSYNHIGALIIEDLAINLGVNEVYLIGLDFPDFCDHFYDLNYNVQRSMEQEMKDFNTTKYKAMTKNGYLKMIDNISKYNINLYNTGHFKNLDFIEKVELNINNINFNNNLSYEKLYILKSIEPKKFLNSYITNNKVIEFINDNKILNKRIAYFCNYVDENQDINLIYNELKKNINIPKENIENYYENYKNMNIFYSFQKHNNIFQIYISNNFIHHLLRNTKDIILNQISEPHLNSNINKYTVNTNKIFNSSYNHVFIANDIFFNEKIILEFINLLIKNNIEMIIIDNDEMIEQLINLIKKINMDIIVLIITNNTKYIGKESKKINDKYFNILS